MITQEQIENLILLRAKGLSFNKISKELNISKPSLLKFSLKYEKEISRERYLNTESLLKKYQLARCQRIKLIAELLNKINNELVSRDLSKVSFQDLLKMRDSLGLELEGIIKNVTFITDEKIDLLESFNSMKEKEVKIPLDSV